MRKFYLSIVYVVLLSGLLFVSCAEQEKETPNRRLELSRESITVGVFKGNGVSSTCFTETMESLKMDEGIVTVSITSADIVKTNLDNLDVVIFPGGSGSKTMNNLGEAGADVIEKFVKKRGKGVIGICAGAYLLSNTPDYPSLGLIDVQVIDRDHYNRGNGLVEFELSPGGEEVFPELIGLDNLFVEYYEGPIFEPIENGEFSVLAGMVSDVYQKGDSEAGVTPGKPYFMNAKAGKGRVFVSVGHPESTPGMRWIVPRMVRWVSGKALISYEGNVVRPELFTEEILHTTDTDHLIEELFNQLFAENPGEIIAAIDELEKIRAWEGKIWIPGLLRSSFPSVRMRAAKYLADIEFSAAIPDLEVAMWNEKDEKVKAELENYHRILSSMIKR